MAAPDKDTKVCPGDVLIVYGHEGAIEGLGQRPKGPGGDRLHEAAVARERARRLAEAARERDYEREHEGRGPGAGERIRT